MGGAIGYLTIKLGGGGYNGKVTKVTEITKLEPKLAFSLSTVIKSIKRLQSKHRTLKAGFDR